MRALGATAGALGLSQPTTADTKKTITFQHACYGAADYQVRVSGHIEKTSNVEGDDLDVIINNQQVAKGGLGPARGRDTYTYTGKIEDVKVSGPVIVEANGERLYTPDCAKEKNIQTKQPEDCHDPCDDGDFCPLKNTVTITGNVEQDGVVEFDIRVTGHIELKNGKRVTRCRGKLDPTNQTKVEFAYSGEATVDVRGPGKVCIDQDYPCKDARHGTDRGGDA